MNTFIEIPESEIHTDFIHAAGPGGQNVNKVATAVQLRFDAAHSQVLDNDVKERLLKLAGRCATSAGVLVITARRFRTREGNRADALRRLQALIARASTAPKARRAGTVPHAAREKRLENKKWRAGVKRVRRATRSIELD